ncbi:uncharacterized protein YpgQ [Impatiens glandulifera]|uniref:uncharacterized protein YpgQ n=1 Tax=Impatiens glandulifera TaxID=253017 RepID=UPI001FB1766D|nr:uncharacterized protein YpgQ [Impatiens glandulifera]XP_047311154.1 uncharacterized protein YpgQ [Impatiens glandulifera]XP_047311155.1 uncharacterized protein YpgQ [Impatiens glandulifera]
MFSFSSIAHKISSPLLRLYHPPFSLPLLPSSRRHNLFFLSSSSTGRNNRLSSSSSKMGGDMGIVRNAEDLVQSVMKSNDASHDPAHVFRVRDLALSLAAEEGLSSSPDSMLIVEIAALLHDIGDYKYVSNPSEEKIAEDFLDNEGIEENKKLKILSIIKRMGFKDELGGNEYIEGDKEFGVVQDADRLDAIGAMGIARCFTFGGSRKHKLHDPAIKPRLDLSKESYMNKEEQTTINHFHEKLLKLKDLMKTESGKRRAEKRHKFMETFVQEFYEEWDGKA